MINRLPWRKKLRTSAANNLDKINEIIDYINTSDISPVMLSDSASGRSVVAGRASSLKSLVIEGESIQDGTPTPDAPVEVQVVEGANLFTGFAGTTPNAITATANVTIVGDDMVVNGTAASTGYTYSNDEAGYNNSPKVTLEPGTYTVHEDSGLFGVRMGLAPNNAYFDIAPKGGKKTITVSETTTISIVPQLVNGTVFDNVSPKIMVEKGDTATAYVSYGSIGIVIGDTATPIDLQGNVLASLPDGTRDTVTVDGAGHVVLEKRTKRLVFSGDNSEGWSVENSGKRVTTPAITGIASPSTSSIVANILCSYTPANSATNTWNANLGTSIQARKIQVSDGTGSMTVSAWTSSLAANPMTVVCGLLTPTTIDLGYIDMPAIESGDAISVSASITPVIDAAWWHYDDITDIIRDLKAYVDYKTADGQEQTAGLSMSRPVNMNLDTQATEQPAIVEEGEMI